MSDVVVVGNIGIDTNVYFPGNQINFENEANFTENRDYIGQAGGYAARSYARLGFETAFIGHVGDDFSGKFIRETLENDGINTQGLFIDPAGTSRSINFMYPDGRRKNFYDGKSHMTLMPDPDICRTLFENCGLAHFNIPNWARHLLPIAKECGAVIACDLQDITDIHDPYRQDFIRQSDIIFFSAVNFDSPEPLMREILTEYPEKILISGMGANGCAVATEKRIEFFPAVELPEPVIDTNGAGDSLAASFLSSLCLADYSMAQSLLRGQIAARFACTLKADSAHLITRDQLDVFFQQHSKRTCN